MIVKKSMRSRCECEHCGKKNWSIGHMRNHELHCTKNPDRECRVCKMVEGEQKPIAELTALLPNLASWRDEYDNINYAEGSRESVNAALKALRDACDNCPACILAALRQKGIMVPLVTDFDFTKEVKSLWSEINESRRDQCYDY